MRDQRRHLGAWFGYAAHPLIQINSQKSEPRLILGLRQRRVRAFGPLIVREPWMKNAFRNVLALVIFTSTPALAAELPADP